jgi:hypothetical protein
MTKEEAQHLFEKAKNELPSWEVVMNNTYTNEQVRDGVLFNILKIFHGAVGHDGPVVRKAGESFEEAICQLVLHHTGSYIPNREIEEVVEAALEHRKRWQH